MTLDWMHHLYWLREEERDIETNSFGTVLPPTAAAHTPSAKKEKSVRGDRRRWCVELDTDRPGYKHRSGLILRNVGLSTS
jgi:hypothetical protein